MRTPLLSRAFRVVFALGCAASATLMVLAPSASAESCPNAALRSGPSASLPDCRAYEMVTPPYKGGYQVLIPQAGEDGSYVTGHFYSDLAGSGNDDELEGAAYLFSRTASGWVTTPILPPVTEFRESFFLGELGSVRPEDHAALLSLEQRSAVGTRKPDGAVTEVRPMLPPSANSREGARQVLGESRNFSHVLFEIASTGRTPSPFWPFDTTINEGNVQSLYDLGPGASEPVLVGVEGGAGSTSLISQCGTRLGAGEAQDYNAVSADGSTVFFTPEPLSACGNTGGVGPAEKEVFARIDGGLADAHTVRLSPGGGEFQGASEDGSKAFLFDENGLEEYDFDEPAGHNRIDVSAEASGVSAISEDGSHIYFVANSVLAANAGAATEPGTDVREHAGAGADNLYVYERDATYPAGRTTFIAQLSGEDASGVGAGSTSQVQVTPNGRFLVFTSRNDLTPDDTTTNGEAQLFEYDAESETLVRVSIGQNGFNDDGNNPSHGASFTGGLTLSNDGAYVFFESYNGLTPQALNNEVADIFEGRTWYANNVYEYHDGNVYLISDGRDRSWFEGPSLVRLVGTDASGADVFFTTSDQLVAQDTDTEEDVYDARVDGGIPAPVSLLPSCSGDDCQGPLSPSPVLLSPGSEFQAGSSPPPPAKPNATPKAKPKKAKVKRCAKGSVRKHGKCAKRKPKKPKKAAKGRK